MGNVLPTFNNDRTLNVFVHSLLKYSREEKTKHAWTQFHGLVFSSAKNTFWDFISGEDVSKCYMNQQHFLLNAVILRAFELQNKPILKEDGWEPGPLSPRTVEALESLLKAGAKPFPQTVDYVVTTGNAHVMFLLLKYGALRDLIEQGMDIVNCIHIGRPWDYAQWALLWVIFAYGNVKCCKEQNCKGCQKMASSDKPSSYHGQFNILRCCRKHEHICLKRLFYAFLTAWGLSLTDPTALYVKLLIFGVQGKNGLDVPLGPRAVLNIYKPLLLQRANCKAATLTLLGILRKRINSTLPKNGRVSNDVAQLITHMVWDSRTNDAWLNSTQAPDNSKKRTK